MALLNRIEVSNFIRQRDYDQWVPMILHLVFNFRGYNALVHMTNGLGKTSVIDAVLGLLGRDQDLISTTRKDKMAPVSTHRFSHIRVESIRRTGPVAQEDMIGKLGVDVPGEKHVFGFFGNSDTGTPYGFYCYRGTLEDCPVTYRDDKKSTYLVDNKTFREQLKKMKDVKISGASFSKDDWRDEIGKHFELSDIDKMIAYQKAGAGDSIQSFYNVKPMRGESYGSAFFFAHLAPELLTDIMGEDGEPDEKYLEHTIFNSTIVVRKAQRKVEQEQQILESIERKIRVVDPLLEKHKERAEAKAELDKALREFEQSARIIEEITVRNQIPGIPSIKLPEDQKVTAIAASLVLQEGQWYVPDRILAELCDEEPREINFRATQKQAKKIEALRLEVIENPCDIKSERDPRGKPNNIYGLDNAIALLSLAPHFKQGWTKETAISALRKAFEWSATADTNIFRRNMKSMQEDIDVAKAKIEDHTLAINTCNKALKDLADQSAKLSQSEAAYKKMKDSPFFTPEELAEPSKTGNKAHDALKEAKDNLQAHTRKAGEFQKPLETWKSLEVTYGKGFNPASIINELESALEAAQKAWDKKRTERTSLEEEKEEHRRLLDTYTSNLLNSEKEATIFKELIPSVKNYQNYFGNENPSGLKDNIRKSLNAISIEIGNFTKGMAVWFQDIEALKHFKKDYGTVDPSKWLKEQLDRLHSLRTELKDLEARRADLVRRRKELDTAQVASGELYSKALKIAGPDAVPLYKVAEEMSLPLPRRELVLTAFSNFLFAPTFDTIGAATACAQRFVVHKTEAPVFIRSELQKFFKTGDITKLHQAAHTYFLGLRTRPVDCLLNPSLIEEEKRALDQNIAENDSDIKRIKEGIEQLDTESAVMQTARRATKAVMENLEEKYTTAEAELQEKQKSYSSLQEQMQNSHLIDAMLKFNNMGGHKRYGSIAAGINELKTSIENAKAAIGRLTDQISSIKQEEENARINFTTATQNSGIIPDLKVVQQFINQGGPAFIESAEAVERELKKALETAEGRNNFDFVSAQAFINRGGPAAAEEIGTKIEEAARKRNDADAELKKLEVKRRQMEEKIPELKIGATRLDDYARSFIKKYRNIARLRATLGDRGHIDIPEDDTLRRIRGEIEYIANSTSTTLLEKVGKLTEEADSINIDSISSAIEQKANELESRTAAFNNGIDKACKNSEAGLTEADRLWLKESKAKPLKVQEIYDIWKTDLDARAEAHHAAVEAVKQSREKLTERLSILLSQLETNFSILRETVKWKERADGSVEPGYQINAKIISNDELPNLIDRIVTVVETDEKRREEDREAGRAESIEDADIHRKIKELFYREVFKDPEIRVFNQELGKRPLPFNETFSTGQRMALTLLWMLKIADFAVEKNIRRETSSSVQRKKLRAQQERTFIIDGIFSNISSKALIKETLSAIGRLKTKFQLIGFYHNPVAVYDENIFPVYIFGNQMRSPESPTGFVYLRDGKMVSPQDIGIPEGQVITVETHFDKLDSSKKKAS